MNGLNAPLSPVSLGGSEFSYPVLADTDGPYPNSRAQLISPPDSGGGARKMMNGFPPGPRSVGGPSPPPSVGRSSAGTNIYARSDNGRSDNGRGQREDLSESILSEHYVFLKRFLSSISRDGKPSITPNNARNKLLRLTAVQFLDLSTDVYDELKRREAVARRPPNIPTNQGPPQYLLPEDNFHPKRNSARRKLASLPPARFRDLVTDVFCELERRFPRFAAGDIPRAGSSMSIRAPPSRSGTPVSSIGGYPPRGQSRRRPSEASSILSGRSGPAPLSNGYSVPPSPGLPNGDFGRPMPKQFQSNTIVPNKSTMLEEDDEPLSPVTPGPVESDSYGLDQASDSRESKRSAITERSTVPSESDGKLIEDYESQVRELRERLDSMEDALKKKDDELNNVLDDERSRASAVNLEKKEWADTRQDMENRLAEAQNLNDSLQQELERIRDDHADETRRLREEMEEYRQSGMGRGPSRGAADADLGRENEDLRMSLERQQQVTDEVRREAQEFLREMKMLSGQSESAWAKQNELEKVIEQLEGEVRDWRNRYARTKTQLRNMRASSLGLEIGQDAGRYVKDKGFTHDDGLVKDVHVTKFQIAIDELLSRARTDSPDKVTESMKAVVVSVRRITKDINDSSAASGELNQQQAKLKARVSSTANNLITASKNFATGAGISPVSLLDAAASHLVAAVVELLRTVKIRSTPAGELEDDDDGSITPVDSTGFFSPRSNSQSRSQISSSNGLAQEALSPPAPPFQGLGYNRGSADSSAYSPVSSPRESFSSRRPTFRGPPPPAGSNGMSVGGYLGLNKGLPAAPNGYGAARQPDGRVEDAKNHLDDQMAILVPTISNLVQLIRDDANIDEVTTEIDTISDIVGGVVSKTQALGADGAALVDRLDSSRQRLLEARDSGVDLASYGTDQSSRGWRMWTQTLPPLAFEIARETKELVQRLDQLATTGNGGADEFA